MIRFTNDYNRGAHPAILKALEETNDTAYEGYGLDELSEQAKTAIHRYLDCPGAAIHFLVGGTQTNATILSSILRPYQSVIATDTGHISSHETGAVEHGGHKIETVPNRDGKLTAAQVREIAQRFADSDIQEHVTMPKVVYVSFPSEYGTLYSLQELTELRAVCDEFGLYLMLDGARMGYGLNASPDVTLPDIARLADVFYIGGTKCGLLFGEAVVIPNPALQQDFRSCIKQGGGMLAKGWLTGLQFYTMFKDGLYFEITRQAVEQSRRIREAFEEAGIPLFIDSPTNQQFVVVTHEQRAALAENYCFLFEKKIDDDRDCIRFCTAWSTRPEEVDALVRDIARLPKQG